MSFLLEMLQGFGQLAQLEVLGFMLLGFLIGAFFGAMPGLTSVLAMALLLPLTYSIDVIPALVMSAAIFMSGMYAGSITATTINIPGAPSSMMTALEGNRLMKKGAGANALGHAALGSMIGGTIGTVLLMGLMPLAAKASLLIQTPGKFSMVLFALLVIIIVERAEISKGIVATMIGIMVATIGIDVMQPIPRMHFGTELLVEGIDMMPIIIGSFAICEVLTQAQQGAAGIGAQAARAAAAIRRRDFLPGWNEIREIGFFTYIKSALIGYGIGILPGAGGSMSAFVAYADAKRASRKPDEYGRGSREGIAAAESANNAMCGGAFVPMLTFGIPGDPTTAVVLGVLVINGLQPGPRLLEQQADLIAPMFASLLVSALFLIPLTLFLFGPWFIRIVSIPRGLLYASIAVVALVGSYVATFSVFQMSLSVVFGVLAFFLRRYGYPTVSMLLGFILGPSLEQYLRRSLALNDNNPMVFFTRPDSLFFLVLAALFFYMMVIRRSSGSPPGGSGHKKTPASSETV